MRITATTIPGAYVIEPHRFPDHRGAFFESMRTDVLEPHLGKPFVARQINYSVSRRGTLRGIHGSALPPGQAKFVSCVRGAMRDIIVDLRVGSPTFGRHVVTELDPASGRALYIPEGVGHAFLALADDTCACYAVSTVFAPQAEIEVDALDPELALPWELSGPPVMSDKDRAAPTLAAMRDAGRLPAFTA
ncbi:dTDP-4-dehydrorhamnose 3,5-epimerase family protein [Micromonospora sp. NPDC002296]|uniref:dTDP-4-dehydrorhamnose 3,5-epimerase family protein n=1 Tax=Micromonospora sp. NPDC002296 TaxID=3154271 RepID=UPI00333194D6